MFPADPRFLIFFLSAILTPFSSSSSQISISISPQILLKSNDQVQISWTGINSPSDLDWLGIYSPPSSSHDDFIGYVFLSSSSAWLSGSGSVNLTLVNLRSNYEFRVFRWTKDEINLKRLDHDRNPLPQTKHLLARSGQLGFRKSCGPEQIHLSYTDRDDEMRAMFVTDVKVQGFVKYGLWMDRMHEVGRSQVESYGREDMCDSPANETIGWRHPGYIHDVVMTNLLKGRRYYYQVGSDSLGWSSTHSFMSRNEDSDETLAFLFGDMGASTPYSTFIRTQEESKLTIKWILRDLDTLGDKPAFISHIGDISYARGYSWIWDTFFTQIEPIASRVPYHVCIGNHEYDWPEQPWRPEWSTYGKDGGGECGVPYSHRFNMPGNSSEPTGTRAPSTRNLFYSFDTGAIHFLYISTETNFLSGSRQYEFIEHDLRSVKRTKTPFVVVQGHRPMYTTSNENRDTPLREKLLFHLEPLFVKYNVTLALWGHVHRYERFCALKNYTCCDVGPVHAVIGMGGQDWQASWQPRPDHTDLPIFPQPPRSMYRGGQFGYTRIIATKEKLTFSYVGNHDGEVHDAVEILASRRVSNGGTPFSSYYYIVKGCGVLVLGAFIGFVVGRWKGRGGPEKKWVPVRNDDV